KKIKKFTGVKQFTVAVRKVRQSLFIANGDKHLRRYEAHHLIDIGQPRALNVNASPTPQAASTTAVGGPGVLGSGGDAIAVTNQDADSTNKKIWGKKTTSTSRGGGKST